VVVSLVSGFNLTGTEQIQLLRQGNDLVLTYLPVPEPGLMIAAGAGLMTLLGLRLRRRS
jgi:hypothetical protein